jgi:hypothetical protein
LQRVVVPRLVHRDNLCLRGPAQSPEARAILGRREFDLAPEQVAEESCIFIADIVGDSLDRWSPDSSICLASSIALSMPSV